MEADSYNLILKKFKTFEEDHQISILEVPELWNLALKL